MFMNLKCKSDTLSQCVCIKMLTNDINNYQKRKKVDTIDSTTQNKGSHAMKIILEPRTPKISKRKNAKSMIERAWGKI